MFESLTSLVLAGVGVVLGLIVITSSFVITRQKTAKIIERFGKFNGVRTAGLGMKLPWPITYVAGEINLRIQELAEDVGVKTNDNAFLSVPVKVQYRTPEDKVHEAFYELDDAEDQITSYIVNVVRSQANDMKMEELFRSKNAFETAVEVELKERFSKYGYEVVSVLVDDPQPSDDLRRSFDLVLASEREKEAAANQAEAMRIKMVGGAKAEAESLTLKATAYVEQRRIISTGIKEVVDLLHGVEGLTHERVLTYLEGIDMRDTIRDAARGPGSLVLLPIDLAGNGGNGKPVNDLGNLAFIKQLLQQKAVGSGSGPEPPTPFAGRS